MRIGLIRRRHALAGGAEQTVARLAGEFVARGHAVTVVAERWGAQLPVGVTRHVVFPSSQVQRLSGCSSSACERCVRLAA